MSSYEEHCTDRPFFHTEFIHGLWLGRIPLIVLHEMTWNWIALFSSREPVWVIRHVKMGLFEQPVFKKLILDPNPIFPVIPYNDHTDLHILSRH